MAALTAAPLGAEVGLYYDGPALSIGDHLVTDTGRRYEVEHVRVQARGTRAGRQHVRATVVPPDAACDGAVHPLCWYRR